MSEKSNQTGNQTSKQCSCAPEGQELKNPIDVKAAQAYIRNHSHVEDAKEGNYSSEHDESRDAYIDPSVGTCACSIPQTKEKTKK